MARSADRGAPARAVRKLVEEGNRQAHDVARVRLVEDELAPQQDGILDGLLFAGILPVGEPFHQVEHDPLPYAPLGDENFLDADHLGQVLIDDRGRHDHVRAIGTQAEDAHALFDRHARKLVDN